MKKGLRSVAVGSTTFEANDHPTSSRRVLRLGSVHRHSSLHSHFRAKFGHEKVVLGTPIYLAAGGNMIAFDARCLLDF